jgi:hypothetical protein
MCGVDIIDGPAPPQFAYASTGFSIHVMQFRSADPAGDPNPPVRYSVSITPEAITTNTRPSAYNGYTQKAFEKYAWCGCSCAFEAGRTSKQDSAITTRFGDVGIAVLGRTWQLECCVDRWDEECSPGIGTTGPYVTCTDFRGENGWTDAANHTCSYYVDNGLCTGGQVVAEGEAAADALDLVLTEAQRNTETANWTVSAFISSMADVVGTDAAEACCWCGGGAISSTYEPACMDFYAENYFHGEYDGTGSSPPVNPPDEDPPYGYVVSPEACVYAFGCRNASYANYDASARVNDMSCDDLAFSASGPVPLLAWWSAAAFVAVPLLCCCTRAMT